MRRPFLPADRTFSIKFLHTLSDKEIDVHFMHTLRRLLTVYQSTCRLQHECGNIIGRVTLSSALDVGKTAP